MIPNTHTAFKGDIKNEEFVPKLHIVYNGKNYEMTLKNREAQDISIKTFILEIERRNIRIFRTYW